jgi:flagellar biosynthesis component FlhA
MTLRDSLSRASDVLERLSPFVSYLFGVIFIAEAVFGWFGLAAIAEHPEVFFFIFGFILWTNGSTARDSQKKVRRLERKLETREEHIEQLREIRES